MNVWIQLIIILISLSLILLFALWVAQEKWNGRKPSFSNLFKDIFGGKEE